MDPGGTRWIQVDPGGTRWNQVDPGGPEGTRGFGFKHSQFQGLRLVDHCPAGDDDFECVVMMT